jgi:hypothetical protein
MRATRQERLLLVLVGISTVATLLGFLSGVVRALVRRGRSTVEHRTTTG